MWVISIIRNNMREPVRIKLIANGSHPCERWIGRWGLSFVIDEEILFDAFGDAWALMGNLNRFKVDIDKIRQVAISHEHWDHVEGLCSFLERRPHLKVYFPQHSDKNIKDKISVWGGDVVEVKGPVKLKDGVYLSGEIATRYADKAMFEQALVLETEKGLVIVAGCAHPGIMKIVNRVKKDFLKPVYGVIGGFHLKGYTMEDIALKAARLKAAGINMVVPLHCTGAKAKKVFQQVFGSGCLVLREGQEIKL